MRLHQRLRREQGRHTDDWLITYADTITLLLCLFVIILSIRTGEKSAPRNEAPVVVRAPASEDIFASQPPFPPVGRAMDLAGTDTDPDAAVLLAADVPGAIVERSIVPDTIDAGTNVHLSTSPAIPTMAIVPEGTGKPEAAAPGAKPESAVSGPPAIAGPLKFQGTNIVEQRGDRITTLRIDSGAFFGSGYATISAAGSALLRDVAITLQSKEFAAYRIAIEGHTDDTPISNGQFQSNWELSTARAAAVVRFLLEQGIAPGKLTAAGYADTFPIAPNRTAAGAVIPENQALNRRVVIRLEKIDDRN